MHSEMAPTASARRTRRWLTRIGIGVGLALVLLISAGLIVFYSTDWTKHVATVTDAVQAATGRELMIEGDVELGLFPPRVVVNRVRFANAPWGSRPEMITARRIDATIRVADLFRGSIALRLTLDLPDVLLEVGPNGVGNWVLKAASAPSPVEPWAPGAFPLEIDSIKLNKGLVVYREGPKATERRVAFDEITLVSRTSRKTVLKIVANIDGNPVRLAGTIGGVDELIFGKAPVAFDLKAQVGGAQLTAAGKVQDLAGKRSAEAKLAIEIDDLPALGRLVHAELPKRPTIKLAGQLTEANGLIKVADLDLTVGESSLRGSLAADLRPARPRITGTLTSPLIDVPKLTGIDTSSKKPASPGNRRLLSPDPLPIAGLHAVDAKLDLEIERLVITSTLLIQDARGSLNLNRGRLAVEPLAMQVGGGNVELRAILDASNRDTASLTVGITGSGIELGKMMTALGAADQFTGGPTEIAVNLSGRGVSATALAATMNGHVRLIVGPGRVKNRTLDAVFGDVFSKVFEAVNPFRRSEPYSDLQCAVVNVPVRAGVVPIEHSVAFETNKIGVSTAGVLNLGTEEIDLAIKPKAKEGLGIGLTELAGLVKIGGTFVEPKVEVDPVGTAKTYFRTGIHIATGGLTLLADRLVFSKYVLDAPCEAALKKGREAPDAGPKTDDKPAATGGALDWLLR